MFNTLKYHTKKQKPEECESYSLLYHLNTISVTLIFNTL